MKALAIAGVNLRRLFRQRSNLFFFIIFPMLLILLLGASFGGSITPVMGVVGGGSGTLDRAFVGALEQTDDLDVRRYDDEDSLVNAVERGRIQAGVVVPTDLDTGIALGETVSLRFYGRPDSLGLQLRAAVEAAAAQQSVVLQAARFAVGEGASSLDVALVVANEVVPAVPGVTVERSIAGESIFPDTIETFDLGASSQLVLFVFLTSLTGAVALIETRRMGVARRMMSTPTPIFTMLVGEGLGRFGIAVFQGLVIMLGSALLFGVDWGSLPAAGVLLVTFALVGTGAGMLLGSALNNDQQAGSMALLVGLGMAAAGGCMVPLQIFPETLRTIAHVTPHAWANDALAELIWNGGQLTDIVPELGVLLGYAAALITVSTFLLRRAISRS